MEPFLKAGLVLLPLAYLLLTLGYADLFLEGRPLTRRVVTPLLWATIAFHLAYLVALGLRWEQLPAATVPQALSLVGFAAAVVYALIERIGRDRSTGIWMLALIFLFQLLASLLDQPEPPVLNLFRSPLFATHISLALLGYAAFVAGAAYGFVFLRLYRELKSGRFRTFYGKLPPLEVLERMMGGALEIGFLALTGAVVAGFVQGLQVGVPGWTTDPKVVTTLAIWLLYGVALGMRRLRRWHGRQTAVVSLLGLGAIVASMLTLNLFFGGFHG
jgi:ABC-type uncharacterized transport system permease subunit